jgi:hypothetical protein
VHLLLAILAAASTSPRQLNGPSGQDDPNVVLRVCPGGCASTLQGSWGESLTYTGASAHTCPNDDGTVQVLGSGVPCMPKATSGASNGYGYRIRPAVTNLVQFYNAMATAPWTTAQAGTCSTPTVTNNTTDLTAPDGSSTATKVVFGACAGTPGNLGVFDQLITSTTAIGSVYARTLSGTCSQFLQQNGGAAGQSATISGTTSWQRFATPSTATTTSIQIGNNGNGALGATSACTLYFWGAQEEASNGGAPEDLCPTAGATATCVTETLTLATGANQSLPAGQGCVSLDFTPNSTNNLSGAFLYDDRNSRGGSGTGAVLYSNATAQQFSMFSANAPTDCTSSVQTWTAGVKHHLIGTWNNGVNQLSMDGALIANCSSMPIVGAGIGSGNILLGQAGSSTGWTQSNVVIGRTANACP